MPNHITEWHDKVIHKFLTIPFVTFLVTLFLSPVILGLVCSLKKEIKVTGKVVNKITKQPLAGTTILVEGRLSTPTDIDGNFIFYFETSKPRFSNYLCQTCSQESNIYIILKNEKLGIKGEYTISIDNSILSTNESKNNYIEL